MNTFTISINFLILTLLNWDFPIVFSILDVKLYIWGVNMNTKEGQEAIKRKNSHV